MLGTPLIESKLARPRLRAELVERPRVNAALERAAEAPVVLVSAPAGYGKSVAVTAWLQGTRAAWVLLDEGDNDPVRLWTYAAAAFETQLGDGPIEASVEALAARRLPLVLEDVHEVSDPRCLATIAHAARVFDRLVLISRTDPPIRLPRLRAQGALGEVRADTLAFTVEEAAHVLGSGDAQAISERTEGWPAAVYLVALWLRGGGQPDSLPHEHLSEFVATEVLAGLEPNLRDFLVRTSVLPRLSAALCDHVLEIDDSADRLAQLLRRNLFIVALDGEAGWYRYHPLFRELVRGRLQDAAALHRRASGWFEAAEQTEDAAEHAREAGDFGAIADIIERNAYALANEGRVATLLRWLGELPEDELGKRPMLLVTGAAVAGASGRHPLEVERLLAAGARGRDAHPEAWTPFLETLWLTVTASNRGDDVAAAVATAQAAVDLADDQLLVPALVALAAAQVNAGDEPLARRTCTRALAHPNARTQPHSHIAALSILAGTEVHAGRLSAAREHADQALAAVRAAGEEHTRIGGRALAADAIVARAEGRYGHAVRAAERALELRREGAFTARIQLELALARAARGELERANAALAEARALIADCPDPGAVAGFAEAVAAQLADGGALVGGPTEPLSPAEQLVLLQLPSSRSNAGIAAELYLSANTVKTHLRAIYRKLGVHTRDEAVARAKAVGLL